MLKRSMCTSQQIIVYERSKRRVGGFSFSRLKLDSHSHLIAIL